MSDIIVALHGWNSVTRGWNEGAWNSEVVLPGSTGSVGATTVIANSNLSVTGLAGTGAIDSVSITGDANVSVTGVAGTTALGNTFETNVGVSATGSVGSTTITGVANVSVTGVAGTTALGNVFETQMGVSGTTALGNVFETNVGLSATASVNSAAIDTTSSVTIEATGFGLTASLGNIKPIWSQLTPSQTPNFSAIGGSAAPPLQVPSWIDIAA